MENRQKLLVGKYDITYAQASPLFVFSILFLLSRDSRKLNYKTQPIKPPNGSSNAFRSERFHSSIPQSPSNGWKSYQRDHPTSWDHAREASCSSLRNR